MTTRDEHPEEQTEVATDRPRERQPVHAQAAPARPPAPRPAAPLGARGAGARAVAGPDLGHDAASTRRPWRRGRAARRRGRQRRSAPPTSSRRPSTPPSRRAPTPRTSARRWSSSGIEPGEAALPAGRAAGRPTGSSPTRRSAPTRAARSRCIASRLFPPSSPSPALVCPCHYSTFDPAPGGTVTFGPAGRPLPQLPLMIDRAATCGRRATSRAASARSWWGVHPGATRRAHVDPVADPVRFIDERTAAAP